MPDVPTGREAGMPELVVTTWNGVLAPANTPPAIVEGLHAVLAAAVVDPVLKEAFGALGAKLNSSHRESSATISAAILIAGRASSDKPGLRHNEACDAGSAWWVYRFAPWIAPQAPRL
jgi:hypothetical protein